MAPSIEPDDVDAAGCAVARLMSESTPKQYVLHGRESHGPGSTYLVGVAQAIPGNLRPGQAALAVHHDPEAIRSEPHLIGSNRRWQRHPPEDTSHCPVVEPHQPMSAGCVSSDTGHRYPPSS